MTNKAGVIVIFMGGTPSKDRGLLLLAAKGLNKAETGLARCSPQSASPLRRATSPR